MSDKLKDTVTNYWSNFLDEPQTLLDDKTLRQAAKLPEYADRVEVLLELLENKCESLMAAGAMPKIDELRRELGLVGEVA